jgi:FtsH-binding integral membrane protein
MKLPHRSLAFGWAKVRLGKKEPKFSPPLLFAFAFAMFALAVWKKEKAREYVAFGFMFLFFAYLAWERIGTQEVVEDLERRLDEAQTRKNV